MTDKHFRRMFRGRIRTSTCRIIVLTSLVWLLIDVILIMNYTDCIGSNSFLCKKPGEYAVEVSKYSLCIFYHISPFLCNNIYLGFIHTNYVQPVMYNVFKKFSIIYCFTLFLL